MIVPFLDLKGPHHVIKGAFDDLMRSVDILTYIRGKPVELFEIVLKKALKVCQVVTSASGTDSLFITLKCLNTQPTDEVLTPALSWISSSEVISLCNATPVFVDVHPQTYTLDPSLIEEKITPRTKAIIVVHLYGQAAHITEIKRICERHNLFLIEDCAQAHLTEENGQYVGTFGHAGAFSFYPTKNLGAYGDAGCIVTNDDILAEKMRRFANHGALEKDDHLIEGMNSRMDTIQAAVLLTKLPYLKEWNAKRRSNAQLYNELLQDVEEVVVPYVRPGTTHTFHIYAIRAQKRNELKMYLEKQGIQTIIHYPKALPNLPAYRYLNHKPDDFPVASRLQEEVLSLPIYPELTEEQIRYVAENVKDFYRGQKLKSI